MFAPLIRIAETAHHRPLLQVSWRRVAGLCESQAVVWTGDQLYSSCWILFLVVNLNSPLEHLPLLFRCREVNLKDGATFSATHARTIGRT
jgi:hypothetical protein